MTSFNPQLLESLKLPHDVIGAIRAIGEGKGKQDLFKERAPDVLENLRQVAIIESTESSNRLEGITAPRVAIERLVRAEDPRPANRSEGEIAGYRYVLGLIHDRHEHMDFSTGLILQIHRDLFKFTGGGGAGEWKRTDNVISERRPDGTTFTRFKPTPAWKTPQAMATLQSEFASGADSDVDPLILIALYILDFLCIHPFSDGNGRMVRLITVLLLYREDYEVGRYVSLERLIENTKANYYETLYYSSQGWHESKHDPVPWVAYFLSVIRAAYEEFARTVGDMRDGRGAKTQLVLQAISNSVGDFSISELHERCPSVGWDMVRHVLRAERDAGRLETVGRGRGARWRKVAQMG